MAELPRFVVGVDPGWKSGIAVLDLMTETCTGVEVAWDKYGLVLEEHIATGQPAIVVEESTINASSHRKPDTTWAIQGRGVADFLAKRYGLSFTVQNRSSAKRFATNARLDALGWRVPGLSHLTDAQRQVLLYVVDHGWWNRLLD